MSNAFLRLEPNKRNQDFLEFPEPGAPRTVTVPLRLVNIADVDFVAFKVKTTAPKVYLVRPATGVVRPGSSLDVEVTMQPTTDLGGNHKFLVQAALVEDEDSLPSREEWQEMDKSDMQESQLGVKFVQDAPAPRRSQVGRTSVKREFLTYEPNKTRGKDELDFPDPTGGAVTETLRMKSNVGSHVAFKVKTTAPKLYTVEPATGVVNPGTTLDLQITLQPSPEAMDGNHKFLIMTTMVDSARSNPTREEWQQMGKDKIQEKTLNAHVSSSWLQLEPNPEEEGAKERDFMEFIGADKGDTETLRVRNMTDDYVAFKVKTTAPLLYYFKPATGVVRPNKVLDIQVTLTPTRENPSNHKFLVQSACVEDADSQPTREQWNSMGKDECQSKQLAAVFSEEDDEGSPRNSPRNKKPEPAPRASMSRANDAALERERAAAAEMRETLDRERAANRRELERAESDFRKREREWEREDTEIRAKYEQLVDRYATQEKAKKALEREDTEIRGKYEQLVDSYTSQEKAKRALEGQVVHLQREYTQEKNKPVGYALWQVILVAVLVFVAKEFLDGGI